ncbi:S41 family peptidase [Granulicella tundricola]|uniref:Tricorn protease homolog n=1 Tax=Granulicella tundricola (strain ATCC BAA-1859 / DSM 23138 / MP5ACTX9) TaxID=1198114 RepID=E8WYY7_GRATM|nr:DPP IV N-terminal domain-containing protein [Granulicella tundricola]ADW69902.1 peptidase S41 [Granulicella tundricola MP5ACTX9]
MPFRPTRALILALLCTPLYAQRPSLSDPTISPDGHEIAFVSGGDIWSVPAAGGEAHLLVTHPATESRPLYSPDGKKLAFISTRTGNGNIYILTLASGQLQRLTYSDVPDRLDAWSKDGQWIYFTSAIDDVAGQGDIFRVRTTGGTPLEVTHERYMNEFESSPSPDGSQIAFMAKGISASQWWRNGHAHIDETELWLKPVGDSAPYKKLLPADSKHAWPMWSADGKSLFYMSDASGAENIWETPAGSASPKALTHFKEGRVLWPSIGDSGHTIVFERNFAIWRMDTASGKAEPVRIELRGSAGTPGITRVTETSFRTLALSPDGKKVVVLAHGQLFAASAKDGGDGQRVKSEAVSMSDPQWSPDSTSVAYIAERMDGSHQLELFSFDTLKARPLTIIPGESQAPSWSPNGKLLAYVHDNKDLHVITMPDPKAKAPSTVPLPDKIITSGALAQPSLAWSPDNQWVAFTSVDARSFRNLNVIQAAGGEPHPITFLGNGETAYSRIAWSPDGKYILFETAQRSENIQIARVDLLPHVPRFREDEFRDLFRTTRPPGTPATPATPTTPAETPASEPKADATDTPDKPKPAAPEKKQPEPVKIVFEGIRRRLTILPLGLSAERPVISPDGKVLLFSAETARQESLYTYSLDELAREPAVARQLTSTPGSKGAYAFSPDSKEVFFLENGTVKTIALESRTPKTVAISGRLQIDFDQEKKVVFEEAWGTLNRRFYDGKFNGQDWRKLHDEWQPYIDGAQTGDELRRDINLLIGELNSSHSGINRPMPGPGGAEPRTTQVGNLGLRFDREKYEAGQGLIVREVIQLGPAFIEGSIKPGDKLISINGDAIEGYDLDQLLEDTVNHRTVLSVETAGKSREVIVRPIPSAAAVGLVYRQWVEERRAYVDRISGGKIGYVHLAAMGDGDLQQLYLDIDAQNESKQGVIVDVRNNNGGYINGYALDVFTRKNYLEMTPRNMGTVPSRQDLGQRALGLPTILVTNESTLSDGEDFTEGYRSLQLGKVVGEPTAGWIIFTGAQQLIDGSSVRLPFTRVQDLRGQTMEMHPRPVDIEVDREEGETSAGTDGQLDRAVKELLTAR